MKIAVTGGAGFIGSRLVRMLVANDREVVVVDDLSTGLESNLEALDVDFRRGSITDDSFLASALKGSEQVIHLAALGSVPRSIAEPRSSVWVNATGTLNVLETCRRYDIPLIYSSSSSVYGANSELPKNEDMWCQPLSPYGASKLAAESMVLAYHHSYDLPVLALRFFNVYGPGQRADHPYAAAIPRFLDAANRGRALEVHGDGKQSRDFTYVDTVVELLSRAASEHVHHNRPVNVAFGKPRSILDVVASIERLMNKRIKVDFVAPRVGDIKHSLNSPALLNSLFPMLNDVELDVGLRATLDWMQSMTTRQAGAEA